ncbi:MAG: hypothetical protein ACREP3_16245 [Candidatus Binatia bacterium]
MKGSTAGLIFGLVLAFAAGFLSHLLYQRWNPGAPESEPTAALLNQSTSGVEGQRFRVSYLPLEPNPTAEVSAAELITIVARDVEKVRTFTGQQARIRGRVFRVGHSAKSNTYFINFGPSREALTAVIFNSAVELFEKNKQPPKQFENREVEIVGFIKDHPQYGLEVILEHPKQIKVLN